MISRQPPLSVAKSGGVNAKTYKKPYKLWWSGLVMTTTAQSASANPHTTNINKIYISEERSDTIEKSKKYQNAKMQEYDV